MATTKKKKVLLNSTTAGIVYDKDGHNLGGGERLPLDGPLDEVGQYQVEVGHLVLLDQPE